MVFAPMPVASMTNPPSVFNEPTTTTELDLDSMQTLMKLVDALEDDDDVQRVTTNFEASDEVMAQL